MVMQRIGALRQDRWGNNPAVRGSKPFARRVLHYGAGVAAPQFELSPGESFIPRVLDRPLVVEGYSERPYGRQITDTGRRSNQIDQEALPNVALGGARRYVGDVRQGQSRPSGNLEDAIPRLLAGEVDEILLPAGRSANNTSVVLTRDDFLRDVNSPEEVQQRIAEVTALVAEAFPVRVPRNEEQAEAQAQLQGKLNRRTGLPDDRPSHLRGARGALAAEDAAFNADTGGYRAEDPTSIDDWTRSTPELNPYGKAAMVEVGPDGQFRVAEYDVGGTYNTVDNEPDSTAAFKREKQVSVGAAVQEAMKEARTPMVGDAQLKRMGFVPLETPDQNLIGYIPAQGAGEPVPVYQTTTQGNFRIGHPTNMDEKKVRRLAGQALGTAGRTGWVANANTTAGQRGLVNQVNRGYTFSIGEDLGGSMPLFDMSDQGSVENYVNMLRGQPADSFLANQKVYAFDSEGRPVQALVPRIANGVATGHLQPLVKSKLGPTALVAGDDSETINLRRAAEKWGKRQGLENVSLQAALNREAGVGAFMADPSPFPRDPVVDLLVQGRITPAMIRQSPEMQEVYRSGTARERLNQEAVSAGLDPVFPDDGARQLVIRRQVPLIPGVGPIADGAIYAERLGQPVRSYNPGAASTIQPPAAVSAVASNPNWGAGGSELQRAAAQAIFGAPSATATRPSGPRHQMPTRPAADSGPAYGSYIADPGGQMRFAGVAEELPTRFAPDPIDDVSIYMAQQAARRAAQPAPAATGIRGGDPFYVFDPAGNLKQAGTGMNSPLPVSAPTFEQAELPIRLPRMGEDVRSAMIADGAYPVGRPAGPNIRASYYGLGDPSTYQQAATVSGAMRGFDQGAYRQMANDIGLEVPAVSRVVTEDSGRRRVLNNAELAAANAEADAMARAQERAMAQMAMRIRHRQQNPPASPRLAGRIGAEQQPLNLSSPLY